ncbi:MAG: hypothetical protein AAGC53_12260 [Actinomycetota bacterium]
MPTPIETTIERSVPNPTLMKIMNPLVTFLVNRGWTRASQGLMVLHWAGRKSGKAYSTPVSRYEVDGQIFTTTKAGYRHNFAGGASAELVLDGARHAVVGTMIDDPAVIGLRLRALLDAQGFDGKGRAFGAKITGAPTAEDIGAYVAEVGTVLIDFSRA